MPKKKKRLKDVFDTVYDLEIPTEAPGDEGHAKALEEKRREDYRKWKLANPHLDDDLPF